MAAAQTPTELKAKLPQVAGWTIDETVEVFDPDNLFERINGAAPGYLLFDFKELTVFVYNQNGTGDNRPYITIQVYRHAAKEDAFGIYASERPSESNFLAAGTEGYREGSMLNFFVDCLYVKIESPSSTDGTINAIKQIAQELGRNINAQPAFPMQLQSFPEENKIAHSELYIPTGFLGHEFLNKTFTANYQVSGKKYQLFVMDAGTVDQAKEALTKYMQFTKQNTKLREGRLIIKDRFNGDIECQWKGRHIWGIVNDDKAPVKVDDVLKKTGEKMQ
jgi:hypothetical protein